MGLHPSVSSLYGKPTRDTLGGEKFIPVFFTIRKTIFQIKRSICQYFSTVDTGNGHKLPSRVLHLCLLWKNIGKCSFYLEDGLPYCEEDWNELFTTKCISCGFPIEAGDRWVEALNNNYHSQCFNCTLCRKNLEGQSFFVKSGKPFCKGHARV